MSTTTGLCLYYRLTVKQTLSHLTYESELQDKVPTLQLDHSIHPMKAGEAIISVAEWRITHYQALMSECNTNHKLK